MRRAHAPERHRSLFAASLGTRLGLAAAGLALLWLATLWALEIL